MHSKGKNEDTTDQRGRRSLIVSSVPLCALALRLKARDTGRVIHIGRRGAVKKGDCMPDKELYPLSNLSACMSMESARFMSSAGAHLM